MKKLSYSIRPLVALLALTLCLGGANALAMGKKDHKKHHAAKVQKPHKSSLDGKVFAGELVEKGGEKEFKDDLVFKGGKFRSTACDKFGFSSASYTTVEKGKVTKFEAVAVNTKGGTMKWKGKVKGNKVKARAALYPKGSDKPEKKFKYTGELKVARR